MSEATDPAADPMDYTSPLSFVPDDPVMDWVRKAQLDAEAAWREANGENANINGWMFPVRKVGG